MSKTAQDIITLAIEHGAKTSGDIRDFLCDGAALGAAGVGDADQEAVEEAHALAVDAVSETLDSNGFASDSITERVLADNGQSGDHKVTLCAATAWDAEDEDTLYYLRTNGPAIVLTDDLRAAWDFADTAGITVDTLIRVIELDVGGYDDSKAWAVSRLREVAALRHVLDVTPHETELTYYGVRARFLDEADEEGGGWLDKGHPVQSDALYELARYGASRR